MQSFLSCPQGYQPVLDALVEDFLRDGVELVAVAGKDHIKVEDIIDELIVGSGSGPSRFICTTSHDSLEDALEFAESWPTDVPGELQLVELLHHGQYGPATAGGGLAASRATGSDIVLKSKKSEPQCVGELMGNRKIVGTQNITPTLQKCHPNHRSTVAWMAALLNREKSAS